MRYTDEQVEAIKDWFRAGTSASKSAALFHDKFGVALTRNAIIGKWHRLGLVRTRATGVRQQDRGLVVRLAKRQQRKRSLVADVWARSTATGPEGMPPQENPADFQNLVTFADLEPHHCRWPVGDPTSGPFGFCGCTKVAGLPYCETHVRRAYKPIEPRRVVTPTPGAEWSRSGHRIKVKERA